MSEIKPADYAEIANLLDDASLQAIRWVPGDDGSEEGSRIEVDVSCLRGEPSDEDGEASGPLTLVFGGATALGFSFEPGLERPSETAWPSAAEMMALLAQCEGFNCFHIAHDNKEWFSDALSAPGLDWAHGDEGVFCAATRTFIFAPSGAVRFDGCGFLWWILIAATSITAMDDSKPVTIERWSDQYRTWWLGLQRDIYLEERRESGGGPHSAAIPAAEKEVLSYYTPPAEPIFELEPHDLPGDLCAAVRAWFEKDHRPYKEGGWDYNWRYARSVESWWVDGDRAVISIHGIEHTRPMERDPPLNEICRLYFILARRNGIWVVNYYWWTLPAADNLNERPWAIAWKGGSFDWPPFYVRLLYKLKYIVSPWPA